ncbi:MAG: hypothetical protein AB7K71_02445 [Polyangiaceae bacterium]
MAALTSSEEFPAAHSMDTEWFAIDAEGNVALFDSAETGAVPFDAASDASTVGANFDVNLLTALRVSRLLEQGVELPVEREAALDPGHVLAVVDCDTQEAALASVEHLGSFIAVGSRPPWVLVSRVPFAEPETRTLQSTESVRWVIELPTSLLYGLDADDGLYHYNHDYATDGLPPRYHRTQAPSTPLQIPEDLAALDERMRRVELELSFAETAHIDLNDHFTQSELQTWGSRVPLTPEQQRRVDDFVHYTESEASPSLEQTLQSIEARMETEAQERTATMRRNVRLVIAFGLLASLAALAKWRYG